MSLTTTFTTTFVTNLKIQIRGTTLTGWTIISILSPLVLFAGAWVVVRFLGGDPSPDRFHALTGYPSYLAFVVLGVAFHGLATSTLEDGGSAVYEEEANGTWDILALAPFNRFVWMGAKTLAGLVTSFVDFFAVLALGAFAFDVAPTPRGLAIAGLGIVLTLVALQGFGFAMAALGLVWKQPYAIAFLLTPVLILLSGMMFPIAILPAWARVIAYAIPLTHGLVIVREAILLDRALPELLPTFAALIASGAVLMAAGFAAFRVMERRARLSGVLGKY